MTKKELHAINKRIIKLQKISDSGNEYKKLLDCIVPLTELASRQAKQMFPWGEDYFAANDTLETIRKDLLSLRGEAVDFLSKTADELNELEKRKENKE